MDADRFVFDTNALVSAACFPRSFGRKALDIATRAGKLLVSSDTLDELRTVLAREKFDRYVHRQDREAFFAEVCASAELVTILQSVRVCRDPKDDKFLEVTVAGGASMIITRDKDLLTLDPWRGIRIVEADIFVLQFQAPGVP